MLQARGRSARVLLNTFAHPPRRHRLFGRSGSGKTTLVNIISG